MRPDSVYSVPGTNYALHPGESFDNHRQLHLLNLSMPTTTDTTRVSEGATDPPAASHHHAYAGPTPDASEGDTTPDLASIPFCFVCDTDSRTFLLDTGANRVIVNDATLLHHFIPSTHHHIRGIGGTSVDILGTGSCTLRLNNPDLPDSSYSITTPAVYVPTSPYNLLPPQLLYASLHAHGFAPSPFQHDSSSFSFTFTPPHTRSCTITVPLSPRGLFEFNTSAGYTSFSNVADSFDPEARFVSSADSDPGTHPPPFPSVPSQFLREPSHPPTVHAIPTDHSTAPPETPPLPLLPSAISFSDTSSPLAPLLPVDPALATIQRKQHLLFTYHERLGHLGFERLRLLAKAHLIPHELASVTPPFCPGCAYGKAHRKPWRTKGASNLRRIKPATFPGQVVSIDQLISPTPGFVPTHRGTPTSTRYTGATVFVDHFSDFTYIHLMTELNATTTVAAKLAFERLSSAHGVTVRHYHADNGLFDTAAFRASIASANQTLSFCGVNAHHQNGRAENRIKDVTQNARTALLHAAHRWPAAIHPSLWPAALKHYANVRNSLPSQYSPPTTIHRHVIRATYVGSPLARFSGTTVDPPLSDFHPFGSPVYVLAAPLQAQHSHNKWQDRARVGIFLCHSPHHASSVPLVLNTTTGLVSPQFHCLYDDSFDSCHRDASFASTWQRRARLLTPTADQADPTPAPLPDSGPPGLQDLPASATPSMLLPPVPRFITPWDQTPSIPDDLTIPTDFPDDDTSFYNDPTAPIDPPPSPPPPPDPPPALNPVVDPPRHTRSGRRVTPNPRYAFTAACLAFLGTYSPTSTPTPHIELLQPVDISEPHPLPMALLARAPPPAQPPPPSDPDTLTYAQAMADPDRAHFITAMYKELSDHITRKHWHLVPRSSLPSHKRALPMVWAFKRKRDPFGSIIKWKARLCAGGHRSLPQVDYWDTYSPVVSWSTVRLMIIFALIHNWHMESIDFVLAYPQAPIKTDIYMMPPTVPPGFCIADLPNPTDRFTKFYKLLRNLYGLKDAGKTWADFLHQGLVDRGWSPSSIDTCLYTKPNIALVLYVDDACLLSPDSSLIASEIASLQDHFNLTADGPLKNYLGTHFSRHPDGSITLSQPHMVDRILRMVGLDPSCTTGVKIHDTPADSSHPLDSNPDAPSHSYPWHYRSVVGSLSYLQAMIRPDLTFAVQQCARFCNDPRQPHAEAVKRICRYLLGTRDQGLTFRPDHSRGLECFVDADWAGSWQSRSSDDPLSAHSRTGYVILFAGCPVIWSSKMQTLIALSTTEAEYIALSSALREVIGLMHLVRELQSRGFKLNIKTPSVHCTVFEDNKSCIEIATNHRTRPRTKHLSVRLHHFRSHIIANTISIQHISTHDQLADIFTKPLPRPQFILLRDRFMGGLTLREGVRDSTTS